MGNRTSSIKNDLTKKNVTAPIAPKLTNAPDLYDHQAYEYTYLDSIPTSHLSLPELERLGNGALMPSSAKAFYRASTFEAQGQSRTLGMRPSLCTAYAHTGDDLFKPDNHTMPSYQNMEKGSFYQRTRWMNTNPQHNANNFHVGTKYADY